MAYNIIEVDTNVQNPNRAIGVKFPFNSPGIFKKTFTCKKCMLTITYYLIIIGGNNEFYKNN